MDHQLVGRYRRRPIPTPGTLAFLLVLGIAGLAQARQGIFFAKDRYVASPLPQFATVREKLPAPNFDENPNYVRCYWKAWELAFKNFHEPAPDSGFVSPFIDAAFNQNIFLWDTCFMTMFCNYAHAYVPGICSLDSFYVKQHEDGEICREINRTTGRDFEAWVNRENEPLFSRWGYDWQKGAEKVAVVYKDRSVPTPPPTLTLDCLNHPILAWAELESYRLTGDRERLGLVWDPLVAYYAALKKYLRQGNGLYMTDAASMDNATRNRYLKAGGVGIDISSEMCLFARNLAEIATVLGRPDEAKQYKEDARALAALINEYMWDQERRFYFDVMPEGRRAPVKSIAAFWTLLGGVASPDQAAALVAELDNPKTFKTVHRVPTLAADEPGFDPNGGYWNGAVWAPTTQMVVAGLEKYGYADLARTIALNHLSNAVAVFQETGTIWENYAPQHVAQGQPAKGDFVGWSGIGPIVFLIEYAIGLKADASADTIVWTIHSADRVGVERFWFGGKTVSLVCERTDDDGTRGISVKSDSSFRLTVHWDARSRTIQIPAGSEIRFDL